MGCDIHPYAEIKVNGKWTPATVEVPSWRSYWSFGVLADVRTPGKVKTISKLRGLPRDRSIFESHSADESDDAIWFGDHSYSHVYLSELLAIDLDQTVSEAVMMQNDDADAYERDGTIPKSWCGWTNAKDYRQVVLKRKLRDAASLIQEWINILAPLGKPEDVRVLFGFDS